jgi:hypothetical protein
MKKTDRVARSRIAILMLPELNKHVMAMESDNGVFKPSGYRISGGDSALSIVREIATLLAPIGATSAAQGGAEADVEPLLERGVPAVSLACGWNSIFLVSPQRSGYDGQAESARYFRMCCADGGDGLHRRRHAWNSGARTDAVSLNRLEHRRHFVNDLAREESYARDFLCKSSPCFAVNEHCPHSCLQW